MISIRRIDHIAMAVPELEPSQVLLEGLFGFRRDREWEDPELRTRGVRYISPGGVGWEVLAPAGAGSSIQPFLDGPRGPGLHHISLEVPDTGSLGGRLREIDVTSASPLAAGTGDRCGEVAILADEGGEGFTFLLGSRGSASSNDPGVAPNSLGVRRLDHLSHAYRDRDALREWYERTFGMREIWRTPDDSGEDFADLVMEIPGQSMVWEIIQPQGDESFMERFLDSRGPAIHHVAFEVVDWDAAVAACEHHGAPLIETNEGETDGGRWADAMIHPRHTGGVLVQFFWEAKPGTWIRSDKVPPPER